MRSGGVWAKAGIAHGAAADTPNNSMWNQIMRLPQKAKRAAERLMAFLDLLDRDFIPHMRSRGAARF
jgi:hypothetical protein